MNSPDDSVFEGWLEALERRHLESLTFAELRRALQALSTWYVQRRQAMGPNTALGSRGKRAAFALFYGPLHFLALRRIVRETGAHDPPPATILDLGCGTGSSGAAWALEAGGRAPLNGVDRSAWAAGEARWTWKRLGLRGTAQRGDLMRQRLPGKGGAILAAYTVNELEQHERATLLERFLEALSRGARVLVVEPIARRAVPWWDAWSAAVKQQAGRDDTWRFPVDLPEPLRKLDRAAGLDHRELTARSLYLPGG